MVSVNKWGYYLNRESMAMMVNKFTTFSTVLHYKTYLQCAFLPLLKQVWSFACDCGTARAPAGTDCYPQLPPQAVATTKIFSGLNMTIEEVDADIIVDSTVVSDTQDSVDIVLSTTADSTNDAVAENPDAPNQPGNSSGRVVTFLSDGFSVATTDGSPLAGPVTLCIHRDQSVALPLGGHVAMVTKSGGEKFRNGIAVQITNTDFTKLVCGKVSDSQTYYAAAVTSSSVRNAFHFLATLLLALLFVAL
jgi:hypothetical protein